MVVGLVIHVVIALERQTVMVVGWVVISYVAILQEGQTIMVAVGSISCVTTGGKSCSGGGG